MTDQQKSDIENNDNEIDSIERDEFLLSYNPKEDNANSYYWHFDVCRALRDYRDKYISDLKSSLKRDIEKRKLLIQNDVTIPEWVRGLKMEECNLFLELIETVEP